jgi:beta-phosphoglucomutase-like phosphatase (HAD superfamily)
LTPWRRNSRGRYGVLALALVTASVALSPRSALAWGDEGHRVVASSQIDFSSERAGFYKPDPHPYRLALDELHVEPQDCLFVAGSPMIYSVPPLSAFRCSGMTASA